MKANEWYGVDLDGTLALFDGTNTGVNIGPPIMPMIHRVKAWINDGRDVRIFTARISPRADDSPGDRDKVKTAIEQWCLEHLGVKLPITNVKDHGLIELWDDRAVQVIFNKGYPIGDQHLY